MFHIAGPTSLRPCSVISAEGGLGNLRALLRRLARHAGSSLDCAAPQPVPRCGGCAPAGQAIGLEQMLAALPHGKPIIPIVFYRSMLLAADVAPIDALCASLKARDLAPAPLFVTSLKDAESATFLRDAMHRLAPSVILTSTAFAATGEVAAGSPLDEANVPVLQAIVATTKRAAWLESPRGLGAADLAMHVVLPGSSTAACWLAPSRSKINRRRWMAFHLPRPPISRSPTGSQWWRIVSSHWRSCKRWHATGGGSRC